MKSADHPYHKWLGIDNPCPNWFELLGIPSNESDPVRIKVAAKAAMRMLADRPDELDHDVWKQIRRQIREAYHGLIDETTRIAYLDELNRKDAATKPSPSAAGFPTAIPLAEIVPESTEIPPGDTNNVNDSTVDPLSISVDPVRIRRKRSLPVSPVIIVVLVAVAASLAWLIRQNFPGYQRQPDTGGDEPVPLVSEGIPNHSGAAPKTADAEINLESAAATALPAATESAVIPRQLPTREGRFSVADSIEPALGESTKNPPGNPREYSGTDQRDSGAIDRSPIDTSWANIVTLGESDDLAIVHHLEQAWKNINRRDFETAQTHMDAVRELRITQHELDMWRRLAVVNRDYQEVQQSLTDIARTMQSLDELQIGEQRIVVITAGPDEFVFRFGQRIALPCDRLPDLLGLAIYGQRHDEQSTSFLMARCLLYAMAAKRNRKYFDQAAGILDAARQQHLPVDDYRLFVTDTPAWSLDGIVNQDERVGQIQKLKIQFARQPNNPARSETQAIQLRDLALHSDDAAERLALVQWSIENAELSCQPILLAELLDLRQRLSGTGFEPIPMVLSSYSSLARCKLTAEQADRLVTCYLELARSCRNRNDDRNEKKCLDRARDVCSEFGLESRLEQFKRMFEDDEASRTGQFGID